MTMTDLSRYMTYFLNTTIGRDNSEVHPLVPKTQFHRLQLQMPFRNIKFASKRPPGVQVAGIRPEALVHSDHITGCSRWHVRSDIGISNPATASFSERSPVRWFN